MSLTTRKMSDLHEEFLADLFGGTISPGSGNQWQQPMDGRTNRLTAEYAFAWDGKSTLGKSVGVSREMWGKAVEQAGGERPMLPLRFYSDERLRVDVDLAVVNVHDLAALIEDANAYRAIKEQGCLNGIHWRPGQSDCTVCGANAYDDVRDE